MIELFGNTRRAGTPHASDRYVYYPPISHIPADASAAIGGRPWALTCDVEVSDGPVEGVLYARGSHNVGHVLFVRNGELHFDYNALGTHHRASGVIALSPGAHTLGARFEREGRSGSITIMADGADIGSVPIPTIIRMLGSTGMDIGCDRLSTVVDDYVGPFPFTGKLTRVVVEIERQREAADSVAMRRTERAKD